jgi:hypothetical protein
MQLVDAVRSWLSTTRWWIARYEEDQTKGAKNAGEQLTQDSARCGNEDQQQDDCDRDHDGCYEGSLALLAMPWQWWSKRIRHWTVTDNLLPIVKKQECMCCCRFLLVTAAWMQWHRIA